VTTRLAHQTQKTAGIPNAMRTATIAAVSGGVVTLSIAGGEISSGVGVLESYVPVVGDVVAVFRQDSSWLVVGSIGTNGIAAKASVNGTVNMSFSAVNNATVAVSYGVSFPVAPMVVTNIDSGAGATARWVSRAINITATGFTMFVFAADSATNTWSNVPVSWSATAR
jgi:hypothetical protein